MIKKVKNSLLIGVSLFLILFACNKKDVSNLNIENNSTKVMLVKYLTEQKMIDASTSSFIDTLIGKSDWSNISQTSISNNVKLFYVPLNYNSNNNGITYLYNNNTQQVYYSLVTEIPKNISTNIAHTTSTTLNRPIDIIAGFYKNNLNSFTGSIRAYSLNNNFLWEYGYEKGNQKFEKWVTSSTDVHPSSGTSEIKSNSIGSNTIKANGCLDWYTVTWYDDGTSDWHYIGTSCDGNCIESIGITQDSLRIKSNCNATGVGVGGSNLSYKIITNNITDPCLKKLITNLQSSNKLTNAVGAILQDVFGVNNKTNLKFNQNDNLKNDAGKPDFGQSYPTGNGNYNVVLNASLLRDFSQERQTLTIMHEILHDYFKVEYQKSLKITWPNDHTEILNKYIDKMASSLEDLYPKMKGSHDVTLALCFDNLYSSVGDDSKFTNLQIWGNYQILPSDFNSALSSHGLSINNWKTIASQAKNNDSPLGTSPCGNSSKQN